MTTRIAFSDKTNQVELDALNGHVGHFADGLARFRVNWLAGVRIVVTITMKGILCAF